MKTYTLTVQVGNADNEPPNEHLERAAYRLRKLSPVDQSYIAEMKVGSELFIGVVDGAAVSITRTE